MFTALAHMPSALSGTAFASILAYQLAPHRARISFGLHALCHPNSPNASLHHVKSSDYTALAHIGLYGLVAICLDMGFGSAYGADISPAAALGCPVSC